MNNIKYDIIIKYKSKNPLDSIKEEKRKPIPKIADETELIKTYVDYIVEIRKKLLDIGIRVEKFYIEQTKMLNEIYELLISELKKYSMLNYL